MNTPITERNRVFDLTRLPSIFLSCVPGGRDVLERLGQFPEAVEALDLIYGKIDGNSISLSPQEVHYCIAALCAFKAVGHLHSSGNAQILGDMTTCIGILEGEPGTAVVFEDGPLRVPRLPDCLRRALDLRIGGGQ